MTTCQPKTKEEVLNSISNEILDTYLEKAKGLCDYRNRDLRKYLVKAESNKVGCFSTFHYIHALVYTAQHDYERAYDKYKTSLNINPVDIPTLNNFATLLVNMNKYDEALEVIKKLITEYNVNQQATLNNLFKMSMKTLDTSYLSMFRDNKLALSFFEEDLDAISQITNLKHDIHEIYITVEEYKNFIEFLSKFVLDKTNQTFYPRFSIDNGLDKQLNIEVFLEVNAEEASYLDTEFRNLYLDYIFNNDLHDLLGKFVVFFRQSKNRENGIENPDALYLGMNEDLVA